MQAVVCATTPSSISVGLSSLSLQNVADFFFTMSWSFVSDFQARCVGSFISPDGFLQNRKHQRVLTSGEGDSRICFHGCIIKVVECQSLSWISLPACSPLKLVHAAPGVLNRCADHQKTLCGFHLRMRLSEAARAGCKSSRTPAGSRAAFCASAAAVCTQSGKHLQ